MGKEMGYLVDLAGYQFDDPGTSTWIQAMPLGSYNHPMYGKIDVTPERVRQFAANVKQRVRGQDLDIDYDHKDRTGEAAGWVKDAEARDDGLWIFVEWTKSAYQKLKEKAYRYFSPEFVDEWEHPSTRQKFKDVLLGGGLTNRPFLKNILPINLSEVLTGKQFTTTIDPADTVKAIALLLGLGENATLDQISQELNTVVQAAQNTPDPDAQNSPGGAQPPAQMSEGGKSMDEETRKALAKLLGLPEDATAEQILGAAQVKLGPSKGEQQGNQGGDLASGGAGSQEGQQPQPVAASELPEAVRKLAEQDPALATFLAEQAKKTATTEMALRLSEVNGQVVKLDEGHKRVLTPAVKEKLKALMLNAPRQLSDKMYELVESIIKDGLVELGERGSVRTRTSDSKTAAMRFDEAVTQIMKAEGNLTYPDAVERIAAEDPTLFEEYRQESFAFREN